MNAIVSEKGQVTIPKQFRDNLGLIPGSVLTFTEEQGRLIATKVVKEHPVSAWRGKGQLPIGNSVSEYLNHVRDGE